MEPVRGVEARKLHRFSYWEASRMRRFACYALGLSIATFAGCGGSPGAGSLPAGPPAFTERFAQGTGEVQYFSTSDNALLEFDYPKSESPIGSINFSGGGECTEGARTFWTAAADGIAEFKVGGMSPIGVLKVSYATNCAIDPATGDLAALSFGGVVIFHKARGKGKVIAPFAEAYFDGYDNKGNLFVDGFTSAAVFGLLELKRGGGTFETITTSNTVEFPGSVQWDGQYLTVLDQVANAIYQYTVSGTEATLKGTVSLSGSADCAQTWIARPYVYCADAGNNDGEVYKYPAGGSRIATLTGPFNTPLGVVSLRVR
jgi:hypothetical protein